MLLFTRNHKREVLRKKAIKCNVQVRSTTTSTRKYVIRKKDKKSTAPGIPGRQQQQVLIRLLNGPIKPESPGRGLTVIAATVHARLW